MIFVLLLWFGIQPAKSLRYACSLVCVCVLLLCKLYSGYVALGTLLSILTNRNGKEHKRMYVCVVGSLCCIAEVNTTLLIHSISVKLKKIKSLVLFIVPGKTLSSFIAHLVSVFTSVIVS